MVIKVLDLFCGAGGAGKGYAMHWGVKVTGVDINDKHYDKYQQNVGVFCTNDALEYLERYGKYFDFIHASPPCQRFSRLNRFKKVAESTQSYPDLIEPVRERLRALGKPYVIENVGGAPLIDPITLCGSQFDLKVYRHRLFETNFPIEAPEHVPHYDNTPPSGRGISGKGFISVNSGGVMGKPPEGFDNWADYKRFAMDIDWMSMKELTEAIPPAYTYYIFQQWRNL